MNTHNFAHELVAAALHALMTDARAARERVLVVSSSALVDTPGGPTDEEALHDFRVALRRMRTILRVARELWRRKRLARIEGEIRYHAQATGDLRDEEVLRETLAALDLPEEAHDELGGWLVRRDLAVRKEHAEVTRLLRDGPPHRAPTLPGGKRIRPLERSFQALAARLYGDTPRRMSAVDLGHQVLDHAARDVVTWAMRDVGDVEAMHELRIRYKRLRYTADLFAAPLGAKAMHFAKHATRMQRHLGELHDIDQAILTLSRARGLGATTKDAVLAALRASRVTRASKVEPHLVEARHLMDRGPDDEPPTVV
ncbi:CHAD domain-containing protein [Polyangium jinanense]|uniref:CHAD domain-containing protein n=1 Tax=Polyangium jinanense TaxID=2829994 RepID=A0A9X4AVU7_9BACT|nr:CHAD domain-containing protein [Polyangium jinanense]MDC3960178.1 CHAD domain-containing protein [Polyangium jinanense]MDC3986618.1 CHAD domain-containing protein [Polyangium jinanense]